jgi:penicillin G amidase
MNDTPVETLTLPGLQACAQILRDRYGIAHLYAQNETDLFFLQGFNAARDRLWQIDLWRKRGLGQMAADFGPAYAERDRAARLMLYRGDLATEFACYGERAQAWTEAFVAGINAWIDEVERDPGRLPVEFRLAGTRPARWAAQDVVRCRAHAWVMNVDREIQRNDIVARFGLQAASLMKELEPAWALKLPQGWVAEPIPPQVLRTWLAATDPLALANQGDGVTLDPAAAQAMRAQILGAGSGSNNWALGASRTESGAPLLASDPHRVFEQPGLRYTVHLVAPGIDVIGTGEPAIPGVSLGHNADLAFSLTIHPADQTDLYVYELDPHDPMRYRYGEHWEPMQEITETLKVRGEADRTIRLRFTRHGPVAHWDAQTHRAYAFRSVWQEPGSAAYMASLRYIKARNVSQYLQALAHWGAPSTNHVVADIHGDIAWQVAGKIPIRPTWDGLLPVPGDGRHEWAGFTDARDLPGSVNPPCGWVASANQMNLPADYDVTMRKTGFEFPDSSRYARIQEVLQAGERFDLAQMKHLQADVLSLPARRLCALLSSMDLDTCKAGLEKAGVSLSAATLARALALLRPWDHRLAVDSAAGALFEIWFSRHLMPGLLRMLGPSGLESMIPVPDSTLTIKLLERVDAQFARTDLGKRLGGSAQGARDALVLTTLQAAWQDAVELLGEDCSSWAWGRLLHAFFEHPLARHADPAMAALLNVGPAAKGGSGQTVNAATYFASNFRIHYGVSWRMIADCANWDASLVINPPGQSGDPASPHYRDHFELWVREQYVPMLYSRQAVEAHLAQHLMLQPPGAIQAPT